MPAAYVGICQTHEEPAACPQFAATLNLPASVSFLRDIYLLKQRILFPLDLPNSVELPVRKEMFSICADQ